MRMGWKAIAGIGTLVFLIAHTAGDKREAQTLDRPCLGGAVPESDCVASTPYPRTVLETLVANEPGFPDGRPSLASLWRVLSDNAEMRFTGEMLSRYARLHPPKPWRGFQITIEDISVQGDVHIRAHVSGYFIHTPVNISGTPDYDAKTRAIFFRVTKAALPKETARPILSRFNTMLTPLATYVAQNIADVIPVKRIKADTAGGWMFLTTVRSVRVDGEHVIVVLHGYRLAGAAIAFMACALLFVVCLVFFWRKQAARKLIKSL